jgi:hypothetical protein
MNYIVQQKGDKKSWLGYLNYKEYQQLKRKKTFPFMQDMQLKTSL